MALPVQGVAYNFYVPLVDASDPSQFITDPTIEAGDFQISIDGSAFTDLTNLPVVTPAGSTLVLISLTADEMTGEKVNIQAIDVSDDEWEDMMANLDVPTGTSESSYELDVGDRIETSTRLIINKQGTETALLDKQITGSLLSSTVTLSTTDT